MLRRYKFKMLERSRAARLRNKLQQIGLIHMFDSIMEHRTGWNDRFRLVQRLKRPSWSGKFAGRGACQNMNS